MSLMKSLGAALVLVSPAMMAADGRVLDLEVKPGTPLAIRLDAKTPVRLGQPVRGTLVHPLYVFDREVLPAGATVLGAVTEVKPASRSVRIRAYLNGRLRIHKEAMVAFDEIVLGDGRRMPLSTSVTSGVPAVVRVANVPKPRKRSTIQAGKERVGQMVANHEVTQAARAMRRPGGVHRALIGAANGLKSEALSYWPFGQQQLNRGATFTAVLGQPLRFGSTHIDAAKLEQIGASPAQGAVVQARLLHGVSSATAQVGSAVRAVTMRPLFSESGQLILPEGTPVIGEITQAIPARRFGRNGKLQVRFTKIDPLATAAGLPVSGSLEAVEADSRIGMQLDAEGAARIPVSKKRFIAPAVAAALATNAVPDAEDAFKAQGGAPGWSGFGLAGAAASLATHAAAGPIGWWGVASSTYFNLVRKASELEFPANTVLEIRFGRPPTAGTVLAEVRPPGNR